MNKHGTKISWTHFPGYKGETWNAIIGCSHTSLGCKNCYAERVAGRLSNIVATAQYINVVERDDTAPMVHKGLPRWNGKTYLVEHMMDKPNHWKKPRAIFVCSMSDLFHETVSGENINRVWMQMFNNPQHIYLILTKRPERLLEWTEDQVHATAFPIEDVWPDNVILGVTVENRDYLHRVDVLRQVPCKHRFVSFEPLLGDIPDVDLTGISWSLIGGESGSKPRYMNPDWARSLRDQCKAAGTSFFMKQMSGRTPEERHAIPADLRIQEFPEGMKL